MNATLIGGYDIRVSLSQRNLETLLAKLKRKESQRTLVRLLDNGLALTVTAESDAQHYGEREPGKVHPLDDPGKQAA